MNIIDRPIDTLKPYDNNPRCNNDSVDLVADSIKTFGFRVPLVITEDGTLITGHTRLKAAKKLGLKSVPCIIADDLTDEQIHAYRLADNKTAEASAWDFAKLEHELLNIYRIDMSAFGFDAIRFDEPKTREKKSAPDGKVICPRCGHIQEEIQ